MPKYHNLRSAYVHKVCGSKNYGEKDDEEYEFYTPSPSTIQTFVNNTLSTVCNAGQYVPMELCQLYFAPTRGIVSFCANLTNPYMSGFPTNNQFIFTLFSWNSCEVDSQDQRLWSMYLKNNNPITPEFQPVITEEPYEYGTFPVSSDWSHYRLNSRNISTYYWIVLREYSLSSNQPTFFPPQSQPPQVGKETCTESVRKQSCFDPTGSPSAKSEETGSPSNQPTPTSSCPTESASPGSSPTDGFLFFFAPGIYFGANYGYNCNNCNLSFKDKNPLKFNAMETAGQGSIPRRIDYNNIINLCNVTTSNTNVVSECSNICKLKPEQMTFQPTQKPTQKPTEKPTPTLPTKKQVKKAAKKKLSH